MKLIVIRHGETLWNKENRWQGRTDIELSEEGKEQAKKLAEELKSYKIDVIYSSPLKRALDTAKEIQKVHPNAEMIIDNDLIETSFGIFEGHTHGESLKKHTKFHEERNKDKQNYKGHGGENLKELDERAQRALKKIIANNKDALISAHGSINKHILRKLTKLSHEEISKHRYPNTSFSVFEINGTRIQTEKFNSTEHLN